jgi:hypothetical protein
MPQGGVVAEVGVWRGEHADIILTENKPSRLFLVDQWLHFEDPSNQNVVKHSQKDIDDIYVQVCKDFSMHPEVSVVRGCSYEIGELFPNRFFDWVYIDACHEYEPMKKDLCAWWGKIKIGGYLCGHDYEPHVGVFAAVNEFVELVDASPVVLGPRNDTNSFIIRKYE